MDVSGNTVFGLYWRATRERLDEALERRLPQFFAALPAADVTAVRDVLRGGKRLRGCLVHLLNDAMGGAAAAAIPRALAVELVQAASLIHDDLVDGDTLRRDRPATWTVHGARRAVLLGDLMFATALERMVDLGREDGAVLAQAIATMAAGAYLEPLPDVALARGAAGDAACAYPRIIHLKTGVLFGAAARLGALAANVGAPLAAQAFEYGARIGEAYQIADDLQDWFERSTEAPPDAAQWALLAPALWHFCAADLALPERIALPTPERAARLRALLCERMQIELHARLRQAMAAGDLLPSGSHAQLLRAAPSGIVGARVAGAP